jgi:hypothetical protein
MTTSSRTTRGTNRDTNRDDHRASPVGAYIATAGAVVLLVSVWLDWVTLGPGDSEGNPSSGYEADSLIPFMAYLALGFALAMLYATVRADRRQHRGLSLASMAAGLASLLWSISFLIDPISTVQYDENVSTETGVYIGIIGALLWTVGSFLLAKEPEGDHEPTTTRVAEARTVTERRPATKTERVEHHDRDVRTAGTTTDERVLDVDDDQRRRGGRRGGNGPAATGRR